MNTEPSFKSIFQSILSTLGVTVYRVAKDIGTGVAPVQNLLKGGKPSYDTIVKILDAYPTLNPEYVLFGVGTVLRNGNARPLGVMGDMEFVEVPFLPLKARASFISTYEESININLEMYPVLKNSLNGYRDCLVVEVDGNSMSPTLMNNSKVLCTKIDSSEWAYATGIYAILYADYFVIKRIKNNDLTLFRTLTLHSDNSSFGTVVINGSDIKEMWRAVKVVEQTL